MCRVMETFNQGILQADAGACRLPIATIDLMGDNREFEV